jgi:hypothetical protein
MMNPHTDKIMSNHVFNSESSEDLSHLFSANDYQVNPVNKKNHQGGLISWNDQTDQNDVPNGGFPPISIIQEKEKVNEQSKIRQLSGKKTSISIKDILKSKK